MSKTEQYRTLLVKKQARIKTLQQEVDALGKRIQAEENLEIITTVRNLCLGPEELTRFLQELRTPKPAPVSHADEKHEEENDDE